MSKTYRATYFGLVSDGGRPKIVRCVVEGPRGNMHLVEQQHVAGNSYPSWQEAEKDIEERNHGAEAVEIAGPPRPRLKVEQVRRTGS